MSAATGTAGSQPRAVEARIFAQAKINLRLVVLSQEADGYHSIETIFHRVELADRITVRLTERGRAVTCSGADVGPPAANLAYRAAAAYTERAAWVRGFDIAIEKTIPVGAGLGGGSADAAAVLRALDSMRPTGAPPVDTMRIATSLGSDVPFLASDAVMALAWGRGERMLTLPALPTRTVVLAVMPFSVATADAYGWLAAERSARAGCAARSREPLLLDAAAVADWDAAARLAHNELAGPVAARHPEIGVAAGRLAAAGAQISMMTGSGSAVFGVMPAGWAADNPNGVFAGTTITRTASRVVHAELTR